jgi:hypothetical protein
VDQAARFWGEALYLRDLLRGERVKARHAGLKVVWEDAA